MITFSKQTFKIVFCSRSSETFLDVLGFVSDVGLGYYKAVASPKLALRNGKLQPPKIRGDRYAVVHLASGRDLNTWLFSEKHVRSWIEKIADLVDWKQEGIPMQTGREIRALWEVTRTYEPSGKLKWKDNLGDEYCWTCVPGGWRCAQCSLSTSTEEQMIEEEMIVPEHSWRQVALARMKSYRDQFISPYCYAIAFGEHADCLIQEDGTYSVIFDDEWRRDGLTVRQVNALLRSCNISPTSGWS
jgi:hypothetical protein